MELSTKITPAVEDFEEVVETVIEMDEEGKIGTKKTTINFITLEEHFPKTTSNGKDAKNGCYFDEEQMLRKVAIEKMNPKLTTNKDLRVDEEDTREEPKGEKNASYEVTDVTESSDPTTSASVSMSTRTASMFPRRSQSRDRSLTAASMRSPCQARN